MRSIAALLLTLLLLVGCAATPPDHPQLHQVDHLVFIWLKEPKNVQARAAVIESARGLRQIPGVLSVEVGSPLASERPMVDDTFDLAVTVTLSDSAALERYLSHPIHQAAAREVLGPNAARVVIYDTLPVR